MSDDPRVVAVTISQCVNNFMIMDRYIRVPMSPSNAKSFFKSRYEDPTDMVEELFRRAAENNSVTFTATIKETQPLEPKFATVPTPPDPYAVPILDTVAIASGVKKASGTPSLSLAQVTDLLKDCTQVTKPKTEAEAAELVKAAARDIETRMGCRCGGKCAKCMIKSAVREQLVATPVKQASSSSPVYVRNRAVVTMDPADLKYAQPEVRQQFMTHGFAILGG